MTGRVAPALRRQRRTIPCHGRMVRQTERDLGLLESLAKMRFATTTLLARLHFEGSRWAANKRLRKLLDAGCVRVWMRSLSEENVYSLARAGARMLEESGAGDDGSIPRGLDRNLDHLLGINQVRVSFAVSLPEAGGEIAWWRSDWELRTGARDQLVPDALFEVRWQDGKAGTFSLEFDNGSRSPKKFLGKMLGYARLHQSRTLLGVGEATVLVVCQEPRDLECYRERLRSAGIGEPVWFATAGEVERGAIDAIWSSPHTSAKHSLRTIATVRYGTEGVGQECAHLARG